MRHQSIKRSLADLYSALAEPRGGETGLLGILLVQLSPSAAHPTKVTSPFPSRHRNEQAEQSVARPPPSRLQWRAPPIGRCSLRRPSILFLATSPLDLLLWASLLRSAVALPDRPAGMSPAPDVCTHTNGHPGDAGAQVWYVFLNSDLFH
jgi:hypothetical protein